MRLEDCKTEADLDTLDRFQSMTKRKRMKKKQPLLPYVSVRPQPYPHASACITMTLKGVVKLVWACIKLIFKRHYEAITIDAYNSDGEKYDLTIVCVGQNEMLHTNAYYTDWEVEQELMCRDPLNPTSKANNQLKFHSTDIDNVLDEALEELKKINKHPHPSSGENSLRLEKDDTEDAIRTFLKESLADIKRAKRGY